MTFVIGRTEDGVDRPTGELGRYRAVDGSAGAPLQFDIDGPHAAVIVGKRGYGKSYTLGVIAEELAGVNGIAPVVVDPMGIFGTLAAQASDKAVPAEVIESPAVTPDSLDPRSWCALLGLSPESGAGGLLWQATENASTLAEMRERIAECDAPGTDRRSAVNHLRLAESWGVFDPRGLDATNLSSAEVTVLDVSGLDRAPMNAVVRGVAETLYKTRIDGEIDRLPWLLVDEAHTFFEGVAASALQTLLTRGRAPGVSLVLATQRPSALSAVAVSQSDILLSHRLTAHRDIEALRDAQPTYMNTSLMERMPTDPGEVLIVDDSTETVHTAQVRQRATPHGGGSPSVSTSD